MDLCKPTQRKYNVAVTTAAGRVSDGNDFVAYVACFKKKHPSFSACCELNFISINFPCEVEKAALC